MFVLWAWLLADFFSGIVHWAEDRLLTSKSRFQFLESIRLDNDLHHAAPWAMLKCSKFENINTSAAIAWPLSLLLFLQGAPTIIWLSVLFVSFGNLVHRYSHTTDVMLPWVVSAMQWTGLFASRDHHNRHHYDYQECRLIKKEESKVRYCVMTSWLNPILDFIKFFDLLNYVFIGRNK